ncbi:AraC family transcriptional regulator [Mesonia sp. K7]|nr:AraC family transcriptional regulator [Mesonia sp. K7]
MTVTILTPKYAVIQGIASAQYLFKTINSFLESEGQPAKFNINLMGEETIVPVQEGSFQVKTDVLLSEPPKTDLLIIPPIYGNMEDNLQLNKNFIPYIQKAYKEGAKIASLCTGVFLLAETGLLDQKKCSTHWAFYNLFKERYPHINIVDGGIITVDNGIYSSGGANSIWNLLLYLAEKYTNREMAIRASKYFAIDIHRNNQATFTIFEGQKNHQDEEVKKLQTFVEKNYNAKLSVDELSEMVAMSRRNIERRFKKATHNTLAQYIQRVKVEAAKKLIESTRKNIGEVMLEVGYNDEKSFRNIFKKYVGVTPIDYKNKFVALYA